MPLSAPHPSNPVVRGWMQYYGANCSLRAGVHPKIVSSRLAHATVASTLDTYLADHRRTLIEALPRQ